MSYTLISLSLLLLTTCASAKIQGHVQKRASCSSIFSCDSDRDKCVNLFQQITKVFDQTAILLANSNISEQLNEFCTSNCSQALIEYYKCINNPNWISVSRTCSKDENAVYCIERYVNSTIAVDLYNDCISSVKAQNCTTTCTEYLNQINGYLGCCTYTLFNQENFEMCNITTHSNTNHVLALVDISPCCAHFSHFVTCLDFCCINNWSQNIAGYAK